MGTFIAVIGVFAGLILAASLLAIAWQRRTFKAWRPVRAVVVDLAEKREGDLLAESGLEDIIGERAVGGMRSALGVLAGGDGVRNAGLVRRRLRSRPCCGRPADSTARSGR